MHDREELQPARGETGLHDTGTTLLPEEPTRPRGAVSGDAAPAPPAHRSSAGIVFSVGIVLLLAGLIYAGIHARGKGERQLTQNTEAVAVPTVRVTTATGAGEAPEIVLPANVSAYIDTPIYARTSGYLQHWYADIGTHVQKGALLAVIQTPELDQQVMQAQADVKTAESNLQIAQTTAARWQRLLAKNAVSRQEAEQTTSDLSARESALSAQQANLKRVQELQEFERIYAPFSGIVAARNVDVGSLIEAGQNTTQKELFHLASTDKLRIFVAVPEVYQSAVHDGARIPVTVDAFPNQPFTGTLTRSSHAVDPASRTLNAEVDINNTTGKLLPGAYAFVHLALPAGLQGLRVPSNTLLFRGQGMQVGVVEGGRVTLRDVKIGHDYGATVEITQGLSASDRIVLDPSDSLESGDQVRVQESPATGGTDKRAAE